MRNEPVLLGFALVAVALFGGLYLAGVDVNALGVIVGLVGTLLVAVGVRSKVSPTD